MRTTVVFLILIIALIEILQVYGQKCPTLKSPKNGRVRIRARGRIAKFRCWRKFTLLGPKIIICSGNKWSLRPPVCVRKGCKAIESTMNMTVTASNKGAVLTFKCVAPLKLTGDKILTCDGKKWSAPEPFCEFEEPGLHCDFEDENICGWQHDTMANFKWQWTSGTTPTRRTGPSYDHTLGKGKNGHYMYMESSSPIKKYDKARLQSPYFDATTGSECFDFWYHMLGQTGARKVGNLKIYTEELGATGSLKEEFSISGNQGDMWLKGTFSLGERKKSFRFVIEGQKLESYLSDISIDDVRLYNCSEDYEGTTISFDDTSETDTTMMSAKQTTSWSTAITPKQQKVTTDDDTIIMSTVATDSRISVSKLPKITTTKTSTSTTQSSKPTNQTTVTKTTKTKTTADMPKISSTTVRKTTQSTQGITKMTTKEKTTKKATASTTTIKVTKKITVKPTTTTVKPTTTTTTTIKPSTSTHKPTTTVKPTTTTVKSTRSTQPTTKTTMASSTTKSTPAAPTLPTTTTTIIQPTTTTAQTTTIIQPTTTTTTARTTTKPSSTSPTKALTTTKPSTTSSTRASITTTKGTTTTTTTTQTAAKTTTTPKSTTPSTTKSITTKSTTIPSKPAKSTIQATTITRKQLLSTAAIATSNERVSVDTTASVDNSNNSTDYMNLNVSTTKSPVVIAPAKRSDSTPIKPLMIGVGVGIAIGLIIVIGAIYIYLKRRRKDDIFEDEMEPIAKNAVYD